MSIAELFYPKELKETIADLRAKDDLNEQKLIKLNGFIVKRISIISVVFFCMFLIAYVLSERYDIVVLMFVSWPLMTLLIVLDVKQHLKSYPVIYSLGKRVEGRVERFYYVGIENASWQMQYSFTIDDKEFNAKTLSVSRKFGSPKYDVGDKIDIYVLDLDASKSAPHVDALVNLFKLNKR